MIPRYYPVLKPVNPKLGGGPRRQLGTAWLCRREQRGVDLAPAGQRSAAGDMFRTCVRSARSATASGKPMSSLRVPCQVEQSQEERHRIPSGHGRVAVVKAVLPLPCG